MNISAMKNAKGNVAVLDIGTYKIACLIAEPDADKELHISGIGHGMAEGFRGGVIVDAAEAETSIRCAVHSAEQMAGVDIDEVIVSLSGKHICSHLTSVELSIPNRAITKQDITNIMHRGCSIINADDNRCVVHCMTSDYRIGSTNGIKNPVNMYADTLCADLHIVSADESILNNLSACIGRCHLNVSEFILSSYAAGLGCLTPDEMELGVTLIDIGAGSTDIAVFYGGNNIYSSNIPIGGKHITSDIAKILNISLQDAENIKVLHGRTIVAPRDYEDIIEIKLLGDEQDFGDTHVTLRKLADIIRPRAEEIIEMVRDRLNISEIGAYTGHNAVLTGGGSGLIGMGEIVEQILGKQVRIGTPKLFRGLADSISKPEFSCAVGMLEYVSNRPSEISMLDIREDRRGFLTKISDMIKSLLREEE